ncbi:proliferation marker protein Ki-67 isoform X3 [Hippocampus comes]|uniref:proliferation marker protein Ki-67 isoform X3 n=1 Tax=Hippocampus comes TaxID=109280 RepID=UPI00094E36DC|nr:PREDICTED: proliferation marker protein Ki-67-like isoform X3 [Hippocampus comes]
MPLHGKIVVVKRTGGDGTEFPLTASCLFGRKADCDIRIQLPQVSKEHCRIDLNENKEVILTNLSSVNPTLINGEQLQQSERLKDGDVITIVDRSFRFQSPPPPTPKKFAKGSKAGTPNPHLKNGTNHNIQRALEQAKEEDPKVDGDVQQSKTVSPFSDLYQMIRKSLDVKTPRQSSGTYIQSQRKSNVSTNRNTLEVAEAKVSDGEAVAKAKNISIVTPLSEKKRKNSPQVLSSDVVTPGKDAQNVKSEVRSPQKRQRVTPQKSGAGDAVEKMCTPAPKSPLRCRSQEATPAKEHVKEMPSPQNTNSPRATGKGVPRKRQSAELVLNSPAPQMKKRHVSFGGYLVPELFDKKMPPDSPLRKGENPRRSLCLAKPKQSVLRRASVIGLPKKAQSPAKKSPESPKTSVKKSPKQRSPSPKDSSPQKKTPKPRTPSPQRKLPKSTPASPREKSPGKKSPKPNTPSAKASFSGEKSAKSKSFSFAASEKTPRTPSLKSPKSTPASPKWASPALKSAKPNTPSAKASLSGEKSTKSRSSSPSSSEKTSKFSTPRRASSSGNKLETPLTKGPTSNEMPERVKRASPRLTPPKTVNQLPVKTPQGPQMKIASAQGRFSVSRVETPSPIADDAVIEPVRSVTVTPKIPLRRKSMKNTSRKTPLTKSAIKMLRRSGISRASLKATCSWADTVRFGQAKVRAALPLLRTVKHTVPIAKVSKKLASRAQTPVRKQLGHASTGHAASPVTIVVGRASKRQVTHPVGAPPKVIFNTAISKKNMNMDEDLSGISEMFKTPSKEGRRRSEHRRGSSAKTPLVVNEPSVVDPSVLNTPEEPGEMAVSPLSLASTVKAGRYNKEAVKRLLSGSRESSFVADASALEKTSESVEQQCAEMMASAATTPEQKPPLQESLTGVKRLLKTPKQKTEPLENLRGRLLKTPKQKLEPQECLTGVERILKTPRQKPEPVEDLRGKLLKTPNQKSEQTECLTGVKRIFTTPEQSEPIDVAEKLFQTPTDAEVADVSFNSVGDHLETRDRPPLAQETRDLPEPTNSSTLKVASSPTDGLSAIKRVMKTPRQRHAPVEDFLGIERLMRTPKERSEPVEDNFGIKQLMRSPRLRGIAPVEDFEGLQELMEEPSEFKDQPASTDLDVAKAGATEVFVDVPSVACESSGATQAVSQAAIEDIPGVTEMDTADSKKSVRGRRVKAADLVTEESSQYPVFSAPVRGRRGKKVEPAEEAKAAPKPKRGRYAKKVETVREPPAETLPESEPAVTDSVASLEEEAVKPRRGRYAKKALKQTETVPQPAAATLPEPETEPAVTDSVESLEEEAVKERRGGRFAKKALEQTPPVPPPAMETLPQPESEPAVTDSVASFEEEAVKPRRGRYAKKALKQTETVPQLAAATLPEPESEPVVADSVASLEEEAVKPRRGRYAKKALEQTPPVPPPTMETLPEPESEPAVTDSVAPLEEKAVRPRGGRYAKRALKQTETVPQLAAATLPEPESEPVVVDSVASLKEEVVKPQKGRNPKQPSSRSKKAQHSSRSDDVCQHDIAQDIEEVRDDHQEQIPTEDREKKSTESTESLQEVEITEHVPVIQKKPLRGRRGNPVEDEQGAALEEALVSAPVRAVRRKRTEATAPPAGRLTTRSRNTKTKVQSSDALTEMVPEKDAHVNALTETSETNTSQEDFQTPAADSVVKPSKGRKTKRAPEPEKSLAVEQVQPLAPTDKRGSRRKVISETAESQELEKVTSEETNYQSKPLARGTRGQNAKRKKEQENSDKPSTTAQSEFALQQPTKTSSNKKGDVENLVPVEAEGPPVSEPEQISEPTSGLAKTRRGVVRKQKQAAVTPDSTETRDGAIETATVKPQRRGRTKQIEDVPTAQVPEEKSELKPKQQRGRGLKDDMKQVDAAKRARREPTSSHEEAQKGSVAVPESAPTSAEPVKRGKRPLAKSDLSDVNEKQSNASSHSNATSQEPQNRSRAVKWSLHVEVREIPKRTLRAVRGKRSNIGDQMETQSQSESENVEEDLSEKAAEPQPAKRARRGAKVAKEAESTTKVDTSKAEDAETQPKNRRGRSAKKC